MPSAAHHERDESFAEWYEAAWDDLVVALVATLGDPEVAADAASEACLRALARWDRVRSLESPTAWVYRVAVNVAKRRFQRARFEGMLVRSQVRRVVGTDEGGRGWIEIADVVGALPRRQREVVVLRYLLGMTQAEVANALGVSPGSVAASLNQARTRLRSHLDDGNRSGQLHEMRSLPLA